MPNVGKDFQTAIGRWSGLGPYYAMFPIEFTFDVIETFSRPGQRVLDPFAGRASSIYAAAALGRVGVGIEINPVGWLYGKVKLKPATKERVIDRIRGIQFVAGKISHERLDAMPEFFSMCYAPQVLRFLLSARDNLQWQTSIVDATLMAIIFVHLHGKREQSLSNQMRQGKAMSPEYCVKWWKEHKATPPDIDPAAFLLQRLEWRYAKGKPQFTNSKVILGESTKVLAKLTKTDGRFDLLFTSPPYYAVTNYYTDQWLRLWLLGEAEKPTFNRAQWQKRFESQAYYRVLLERVFGESAKILSPEAVVYVRTDARWFTYQTTIETLKKVFPNKQVTVKEQPFKSKTQTQLFGDKSEKPGEIDIVLSP